MLLLTAMPDPCQQAPKNPRMGLLTQQAPKNPRMGLLTQKQQCLFQVLGVLAFCFKFRGLN